MSANRAPPAPRQHLGHPLPDIDAPQPASPDAAPGAAWDFGQVPLFSPARAVGNFPSAPYAPLPPAGGIQAKLAAEQADDPLEQEAGLAEPVQLCFQGETLRLVRTGPWPADAVASRRLLQRLGAPDDRLDLVFGMGTITAGEHVYAARGLAVGVVPATGVIVGVSGCPACDVATYRRCFHLGEPPREFRAPGAR